MLIAVHGGEFIIVIDILNISHLYSLNFSKVLFICSKM